MTDRSLTAKPISVKTAFPQAADYGWCHTDRLGKDAKQIALVDGEPWRIDYFFDDQFDVTTQIFMKQFDLPMPEPDIVYRGNSQDLLFMDDYGLVIRTGLLDVVDLINPHVLQPLFWLPHDSVDHVIALYGGVQLLDQMQIPQAQKAKISQELSHNLEQTGQKSLDIQTIENIGIVNGMPIVIDLENTFFGTEDPKLREEKREIYTMYIDYGLAPHQAIAYTMDLLYAQHPALRQWMLAYQAHEPLRAQLWDAISNEADNKRIEKLAEVYGRCKQLVSEPEQVSVVHEQKMVTNGQVAAVSCHFTNISMALYHPWTGNIADNAIKPLPRDKKLRIR
jgi:hypothetical protein